MVDVHLAACLIEFIKPVEERNIHRISQNALTVHNNPQAKSIFRMHKLGPVTNLGDNRWWEINTRRQPPGLADFEMDFLDSTNTERVSATVSQSGGVDKGEVEDGGKGKQREEVQVTQTGTQIILILFYILCTPSNITYRATVTTSTGHLPSSSSCDFSST